jgi:hypothetical protein
MEKSGIDLKTSLPAKALVIVFSYHHKNTEKIANSIAYILGKEKL